LGYHLAKGCVVEKMKNPAAELIDFSHEPHEKNECDQHKNGDGNIYDEL